MVYTLLSKLSSNNYVPFAFFNHTSWRPQADPPLPLISLQRENWDKNQFIIKTSSRASWVDLVVNNLDEGPHPFHIVCMGKTLQYMLALLIALSSTAMTFT